MRLWIDAGHGGQDPGASFEGIQEKNVVLGIQRELVDLLVYSSIEVWTTREADVFVSLDERCRAANAQVVDLFLSIHCNADPDPDRPGDPEATGAECFYVSPAGLVMADEIGRAMALEFPEEPWRGSKERGLYVLRHTTAVAVLVEVAFIDASASNEALRKRSTRRRIAFALLRALCSYQRRV